MGKRRLISSNYNEISKWSDWTWESYGTIAKRRLDFGSGLLKIHQQDCMGLSSDIQWNYGIYAVFIILLLLLIINIINLSIIKYYHLTINTKY